MSNQTNPRAYPQLAAAPGSGDPSGGNGGVPHPAAIQFDLTNRVLSGDLQRRQRVCVCLGGFRKRRRLRHRGCLGAVRPGV